MKSTTTALVVGITLGALATILYRRLQNVVDNSDPERVVDQLHSQLEALERRFGQKDALQA